MNEVEMVVILVVLAVVVLGAFALRRKAKSASLILKVGQKAREFTLPNQSGEPVTLSSFRGRWVVLYFYPKDLTSGCTMEARGFQRDLEKYQALDATVLGVSLDTVERHEKFCTRDSLQFALLSDGDGMHVSRQYGVLGSFLGMKMDKRVTFLIDPNGKIAKVWKVVNPMNHSQQVLKELNKLKGTAA